MHTIEQPKIDLRNKVTIVSKKDLEISYFAGPGKGGQAKNKLKTGVQIKHTESGAIGRASDSRSLDDNKQSAFRRLLNDKRMKFFIAKAVYEVQQGEKIEDSVERDMSPENLRVEVKDEQGRWTEVPFHTQLP